MKHFGTDFMQDFLTVVNASGISVRPEHIAQHSHGEVLAEIEHLTSKQNFVYLQSPSGIFLKRKDAQIELIRDDVSRQPEHVGWIVETIEDFARLYESFALTRTELGTFTFLEEQEFDNFTLKWAMFQHSNGAVVQIIWRKTPIFPTE